MKAKRSAPVRGEDRRRSRQGSRNTARRVVDAPTRRGRPTRDARPQRVAPQTSPIPRPTDAPARPKNATQAKARAKARKAKAPKVVRPPLRERLLVRLSSIDLNPRRLAARVPFVVLVIGSLGLGLAITLWLSTGAAQRSYQLGEIRATNQGLLQHKEALERDVLEAQAAPALAEAARNLGMIPSRDTARLVQDPAGNWVVVGTPKPAEGVPPPPLNRPLPEDTPPRPGASRPGAPAADQREVPVRVPSRDETALTPGAGLATVPLADSPHGVPGGPPPALGPAEPTAPTPLELVAPDHAAPVDPAIVPADPSLAPVDPAMVAPMDPALAAPVDPAPAAPVDPALAAPPAPVAPPVPSEPPAVAPAPPAGGEQFSPVTETVPGPPA